MFGSFDINASGLTAQRYRMDVISENIANVDTTRTEDGTPYRRKSVIFQEKGSTVKFTDAFQKASGVYSGGQGVKVVKTFEDTSTDLKMVYDPSHPDADENGYVSYPNVDVVTEMTNMIDATRSYEANATAFEASKSMAVKGLEIASS
jgi:flagellar basal-body rod protein FlgC